MLRNPIPPVEVCNHCAITLRSHHFTPSDPDCVSSTVNTLDPAYAFACYGLFLVVPWEI